MSLSSSNGVSTSSSRQLPSSVHHHRKRKHSSNQSSSHKQQKLSFSPVNKSKDRSPISSSESSTDMANQPPQRSISAPVGGVNGHKISLNNSHVLKGSVTNSNNRKSGQTKKIVIKNLKVRTDISEDYSQEAWRKLEESIAAIHTSCAISYSLEELYLAVENSCSHGMAPVLYENLKRQCQKYTASQLPEFNQDNVDEGTYLLVVNRIWESFCHQMILIRGIFLYLDRTYAVPHQTLPAIWEMGLDLFGLVINQPKICDRILKGILAYIYKERCGESVDRTLLKNLLRMFVDLQLYQSLFELEFLRETEKLYYAESLKMLRDNEFTLPDYLNHIDKRLSQEQDRLLHYLHKTTKKPLILCVEKQLVGEHLQEILNKGFESLLEANRYPQLSLLHQLFSRFKDGITLVRKAFGEYIKKLGVTIVNDMERDKQMVQDLLELKDKVEKIISESFKNESKFHDIVRESFENVINRRQNKPAELVAKYVDVQLRSGNKEWSDEELERLLDRVLVLFRYIHGKDVFEAFYKKDLAKRLLLAKSASFDAEKTMLLKLKQECGPSFTSKLEGMFKDIELSKEMFVNFKQHIQSSSRVAGSIDLSVNVLTMGYWPTYPPMEILLPSEMSCHLDVFKDFYIKKHSGRKLQWQHSLGSCVLRTSFTQVEKELQVSLFQSLVLLLFNQADSLTYTDISQSTGIDDEELKRTLQSLSLNKATKILIKRSKGFEIKDEDVFNLNKDFKHKLFRIKVNQIQMKETVDAAIVRIMKMRRTLSHNLLVSECLSQLRFDIRLTDLKKRIESLIERDYLRRSEENTSTYEYIA